MREGGKGRGERKKRIPGIGLCAKGRRKQSHSVNRDGFGFGYALLNETRVIRHIFFQPLSENEFH